MKEEGVDGWNFTSPSARKRISEDALDGQMDQNIVILLQYWKKTSRAHIVCEPEWRRSLKE